MKQDTLIVTAGRDPEANHGVVNPPVYHASTILFPTVADLEASQSYRLDRDTTYYGRFGTPTTFSFPVRRTQRSKSYCACATATVATGCASTP